MSAKRSVLVLGAAGVVGPSLLRVFANDAHELYALSRREQGPAEPVRWLRGDLERGLRLPAGIDTAIHAAPLWLLPDGLDALAGAGVVRLLAFSSTSAVTKIDSSDAEERDLAQRLRLAEHACREFCHQRGLALTLFRPTMIYGYRRDHNVTAMARFIQRFGFFPVAAPARGRRQPVHADELAQGCVASLGATVSHGREYSLSGGETLTYRDMVKRLFAAMGRRSRVLSLPLPVYRAALGLLGRLVPGGHYSAAMANRMQQDLCFEHSSAHADFGYTPGPFLVDPKRDLPLD